MRIVVASHTYIVDLNREKLRELAKLEPDIEVTVVVPKRWKPGGVQNRVVESQAVNEGSFRVVPVSNFSQNQQGLLTFGWDLVGLLRKFRPHVIQVEQGAKGLAYAQTITLNKLLGLKAKNVFFTWWNIPYTLKFPVSLLEAYNLSHTDGIIAGNQDGADILRDRGYKGPMTVLPQLGVDEALFRPQDVSDLRQKLGIEPTDFVVGFVGRFVEEKGLMTLCRALEGLPDRSWKWLLLGRGPLKESIESWVKSNGFEDRVIFVESVPHDEVYRYINLLSTLVLPSETTYKFKTLSSVGWKEQFGHVLIEAMACRIPLIGSNSGEIPYVIDEAGLVFPEGNVEKLQECLLALMDDLELAKDKAQQGFDRAMKRYTNRAIARQQLDFFKQIIG
ncbi:MAG: hormogonium polysaccharide biosynthesis glycosyltransferase HpsO [Cyanobacteria bacterium SBC]|nr:hormogonium polysaccharide biosynthesis glycosyltransferase HpsO [Cyanobacteria bacterium SBC]